jgi:multicomponent Na+:H+ antiporter subunit B
MIDLVLLLLVAVTGIGAVRTRDLLSATMLLGAYSLLMCIVWTRLNAVDVAFTESAVGAGISAVLLLGAIARTRRFERVKPRPRNLRTAAPMLAVIATGGMLIYGTVDMPDFGDATSAANRHEDVAQRYLQGSAEDMGPDMPNVVTAVLAHYRGYDTMGETTVIFVAAMVVVLLLRPLRRKYDAAAKSGHPEHAPAPTGLNPVDKLQTPDLQDLPPPEAPA